MKLGVNVDHVATVRQARGVAEPDPVTAAAIAGHSPRAANMRCDASATAEARPSNPASSRDWGSARSTTIEVSPAESRAQASVAPTRPPPTMRTSASMALDLPRAPFITHPPFVCAVARRHYCRGHALIATLSVRGSKVPGCFSYA